MAGAAALGGLALAGVLLYVLSPSGADLQPRVTAVAAAAAQPVLDAEAIPDVMRQAMVAVEDERFYSHHGLDTIGLARAAWTDWSGLCLCEGGSTLTQQLADVVYFERTNRLARKLPSMVVALRIESRIPKERILDDYLTVVPMGRGVVGARAASCLYFGNDLRDLTLAQAAELAGMPQAPSLNDPRFEPARARHRRSVVLRKMVELGYASDAAARAAANEPVLAAGTGCR